MPKRKVFLGIAAVLVGAALGIWLGIPQWRQYIAQEEDKRLLRQAQQWLGQGRVDEVRELIRKRRPLPRPVPLLEAAWVKVEVEACARAMAVPRLASIYRRHPEALFENEAASLLLARAAMHAGDWKTFDVLLHWWEKKSKNPQRWFALRVDRFLIQKEPDKAYALLNSVRFPGAADVPRLTRLALLVAPTNLVQAWDCLAEAYRRNPRATDVRLFRGQILEAIGKLRQARLEYTAAYLTDPKKPWLADELAEFYRRHSNYADAVQVWGKSLRENPIDFIAIKYFFWTKVTVPEPATNAPPSRLPEGLLKPLAEFIRGLPRDRFWDEKSFHKLPGAARYERERQEVFWLRLLERLRERRFGEALAVLRENRFRGVSWGPYIERALSRLLSARELGTLRPTDLPALPPASTNRPVHVFFRELEAVSAKTADPEKIADPQWRRFAQSPQALAMAFVADGWLSAGLKLAADPLNPGPMPWWADYAWGQALRLVRGPEAALKFLDGRLRAPELELLAAEIRLAKGERETAEPVLIRLVESGPPAVKQRAGWLLVTMWLEQAELDKAERFFQKASDFAATRLGKELRARLALARNRPKEAEKIYREIADDSVEAKAFLAQRAFARKDWAEARRLTEELIRLMPDELQLQANLQIIDQAEAAARGGATNAPPPAALKRGG